MQKLINSRGPIEDPSPVACASRSLILGQTEGLLSYKATSSLIGSSHCSFSSRDIDIHLLALLKVLLLLNFFLGSFYCPYVGLLCQPRKSTNNGYFTSFR